jgi:hypothetical protein
VADPTPHIGTLRERPLHASLKRWYARPGDRVEEPVDEFVVDLVRDGLLIEIQTRSFSSMRDKLQALLDRGFSVRIVHPVAVDTWILKVDADGEILDRRRSPRHGSAIDVFAELVSFPDLLAAAALEIELLLTVEEQVRRHDPNGPWRRRGWRIVERRLVEVLDSVRLAGPGDLAALLPAEMPQSFTTATLAQRLGRPRRIAQQMAYCLRRLDLIVPVDKDGNAVVYRVPDMT